MVNAVVTWMWQVLRQWCPVCRQPYSAHDEQARTKHLPCGACMTTVVPVSPLVVHGPHTGPLVVHAVGIYTDMLAHLVQAKLSHRYHHTVTLARIMAWAVSRTLSKGVYDYVVPVPPTRLRAYRRGYDHTAILAGHVADALGIPVLHALAVPMWTPAQRHRSRAARLNTMHRPITRMVAPDVLANRHILLIDDLCTTGGTLRAHATALTRAGARVTAYVAARGVSTQGVSTRLQTQRPMLG